MKIKLLDVTEDIFAGGDVPKDRFSEVITDKYKIPVYANAEKMMVYMVIQIQPEYRFRALLWRQEGQLVLL